MNSKTDRYASWWNANARPSVRLRIPRHQKPGVAASVLWYACGFTAFWLALAAVLHFLRAS